MQNEKYLEDVLNLIQYIKDYDDVFNNEFSLNMDLLKNLKNLKK